VMAFGGETEATDQEYVVEPAPPGEWIEAVVRPPGPEFTRAIAKPIRAAPGDNGVVNVLFVDELPIPVAVSVRVSSPANEYTKTRKIATVSVLVQSKSTVASSFDTMNAENVR